MWHRFSTPMKVLFVHEWFGALGGAEANILASATGLQKLGHAVGIMHGPFTQNQVAPWLETFLLRYPLGEPADPSHVRQVVDAFQPDVIYVHKMRDVKVLRALARSGVPVVRMVHDHDLYCMRSYKYNYFTRRICERPASLFCILPCAAFITRNPGGRPPLKWVSYSAKRTELRWNRRFERLVVATRFMKEQLLRNGFAEKKIEIHAPVPDGLGPGRMSSFDERNRIVFAGQLIRGKGVDLLMDALAQVQVPFECFVFGDGNHRTYCEQRSRQLGLAHRVHFQGHVPRDVIGECYTGCSVAVVSSVWPEPFGAVGLEAMQYGVPVVAFDAGGIKEWLIDGHNGYLVPWRDCNAFATRVEELLRDKKLARRLGQNGRKLVTDGYSFSNYIGGLEDLFQRVSRHTSPAMSTTTC
jgi:glycosyltransferase involved in cell wall biosynthesis